MGIANKDVQQAAGSLQVHTGQDAGQGETEAKLLGDAENAFNVINRKAMLHIISITCPLLSTFVSNCTYFQRNFLS